MASQFLPDPSDRIECDRSSIGRTDFPGGDGRKIIDSIKIKLLVLPDETVVYPGHDENTSIAMEKKFNPFLKRI